MSERTTRKTATLLCVDDEPGVLAALQRVLQREGYRVLLANSAREGLQILEQERIDLVISDLRMPEMDGIDFLAQTRKHWPDTLRILMTAHADMTATIAAINEGGIYRYIAKPWDDHDLLQAVRNGLERQYLAAERQRLLALTQEQNHRLLALNANLEDKVRERTAELEQEHKRVVVANEKLKSGFALSIKVFSHLIEMNDARCAGHSRRVAELARQLAGRLGLDRAHTQDVLIAGLLHDIGKLGLPEAVRMKPVSLMDSSELEHYRQHATRGAMALSVVEELRQAGRLVRAHHERFDGLGYPDGLYGDEIPLGAKILAVANDFDAMQIGTFEAPGMSEDEAADAIVASSGKRYDPQVVEALRALIGRRGGLHLPEQPLVLREVALKPEQLEPGMVLSRDLISPDGLLQLTENYVLDAELIRMIREFAASTDPAMRLHVDADKIT